MSKSFFSLIAGLFLFIDLAHAQNNALAFDGANDYVIAPPNSGYNLSSGTIEAWVNPGIMAYEGTILANRGGSSTRYSIHMSNTDIGMWNGFYWQAYPYSPGFTPGTWYHVAFACNGSNTIIYVNGILLGNLPFAFNNTVTGQSLRIGATDGGEYFNGSIDEVRIWSTVRTPSEIQANMAVTQDPAAVGLIAQYTFNQGCAGGNNTTNPSLQTVVSQSPGALSASVMNFTLNGNNSNYMARILNVSPTVSITAPLTNTTVNAGSNLTIQSTATDADGTISKVEFYSNNVKLGETSTFPYSYTMNNVSPGSYALKAIAFDNSCPTASTVTSSQVDITAVGVPWLLGGNAGTTPKFIGTTDAQPLVFKTNNVENMTLLADGNLGIGITNPINKLDVKGSARINGVLNIEYDGSHGYFRVKPSAGTAANSIMDFYENADVNNSAYGYFGIGNDTWGAPTPSLVLRSGKNGNATSKDLLIWAHDAPNAGNVAIAVKANSNFVGINKRTPLATLDVNGNIYASGKIVIGTTPDLQLTKFNAYALAVNGNAIFTKITIKAFGVWPDYVFTDQHKLPSLKQVEQFILTNKRLPEMPSADDVTKAGIDVGENQALLLKKIEEITLYLIEQDKKLKAQQLQIEQLKKQLRKRSTK